AHDCTRGGIHDHDLAGLRRRIDPHHECHGVILSTRVLLDLPPRPPVTAETPRYLRPQLGVSTPSRGLGEGRGGVQRAPRRCSVASCCRRTNPKPLAPKYAEASKSS